MSIGILLAKALGSLRYCIVNIDEPEVEFMANAEIDPDSRLAT